MPEASPHLLCVCLLAAHAAAGADGADGADGAAQSLRCPPSLLRQVLRVSYRKVRCADHVLIGLRPLHLCGTSLEGGHRRLFRTLRFVRVEPTKQRRFGCRLVAIAIASPYAQPRCAGRDRPRESGQRCRTRSPNRYVCITTTAVMAGSVDIPPDGSPSTQPYRRERPWCPPSRRVPHKWSGRRPIST
jgi:hypothetical protein